MDWTKLYFVVFNYPRAELINSLIETILVMTDKNLKLEKSPEVGGYNSIFVLSNKDSSVGFWSFSNILTHPLAFEFFKSQNLTGILFEGYDDGRNDLNSEAWSYQIWDSGSISEWYIYKPENYLYYWSIENIKKIIAPYVQSKSGLDLSTKESIVNSDVFMKSEELLRFRKSGISIETVADWQSMKPQLAFASIAKLFDIPFTDDKYDPETMYIYYDIENEVISLNKEPDASKKYYLERLDRAKSLLPELKEIEVLKFKWMLQPLDVSVRYRAFFTWY